MSRWRERRNNIWRVLAGWTWFRDHMLAFDVFLLLTEELNLLSHTGSSKYEALHKAPGKMCADSNYKSTLLTAVGTFLTAWEEEECFPLQHITLQQFLNIWVGVPLVSTNSSVPLVSLCIKKKEETIKATMCRVWEKGTQNKGLNMRPVSTAGTLLKTGYKMARATK